MKKFRKECLACGFSFRAKLNSELGQFISVVCQKCKQKKCVTCKNYPVEFICKYCKSCGVCGCNCYRDKITGEKIPYKWVNSMYCKLCHKLRNKTHINATLKRVKEKRRAEILKAAETTGMCECRLRPKWKKAKPIQQSFIVNKIQRPVGFEIEFGEWGGLWTHNLRTMGYEQKFDRSVCPSQHELVSPVLSGDVVLAHIHYVLAKAAAARANINDTCGYHVHVGCDDFSNTFLRNIFLLWMALEQNILNRMCDVTRRAGANPYCLSISSYPNANTIMPMLLDIKGHNFSPRDLIQQLLYTTTAEGDHQLAKADHYHNARYYTLNLHSLFYRGTVEFRCKEAMMNPLDTAMWTLFCLHFVDAASSVSDAQLRQFINKPNVINFADMYMPRYVSEWVLETISKFEELGSESSMAHVDVPAGARRSNPGIGRTSTTAGADYLTPIRTSSSYIEDLQLDITRLRNQSQPGIPAIDYDEDEPIPSESAFEDDDF